MCNLFCADPIKPKHGPGKLLIKRPHVELSFDCKRLAGRYTSCHRGAELHKCSIEREIPGAANLSEQQLQAVSEQSCSDLRNL